MPPWTWMHALPLPSAASAASSPAPAAATSASPTSGWSTVDRGGVHRGARRLRPHQHVGTEVLHGLERANGLPELHPVLGVGDGQVDGGAGQADEQGSPEHEGVAPPAGRGRGPADGLARGQPLDAPQRREGIEAPFDAHGVEAGGIDHGQALGFHHHQLSDRGQMLDEDGGRAGGRARGPEHGAHHHLAVGCALDGALEAHGGQVRRHQRTGHECPSELLKDDGGGGHAEAHSA